MLTVTVTRQVGQIRTARCLDAVVIRDRPFQDAVAVDVARATLRTLRLPADCHQAQGHDGRCRCPDHHEAGRPCLRRTLVRWDSFVVTRSDGSRIVGPLDPERTTSRPLNNGSGGRWPPGPGKPDPGASRGDAAAAHCLAMSASVPAIVDQYLSGSAHSRSIGPKGLER